jgi:hypothetical protein
VRPSSGVSDVGGQRLATPPIRGRAGELKVIGALVAALVGGHGGVLVIEGPPGVGKSRLLTEVMALADKSGVRTLFGEAFEYQQAVPFFSLFMATLRGDPPVGDAEALRELGGSADLSYWVVHDLADAIGAAATQAPLAIVLEDIHWADNGTLLALPDRLDILGRGVRRLHPGHCVGRFWRPCRRGARDAVRHVSGRGRTLMRPWAVRLRCLFATRTRSATGCAESRNVPADPCPVQGMSPNCVWPSSASPSDIAETH